MKVGKRFIILKNVKRGKIYGMIQLRKESNSARIITSVSGTTVENLSVFAFFKNLGLTLSLDVTSKQILGDIFSKPTNSFI